MNRLPDERRTAPLQLLEVETTQNMKYLSAVAVPYNEAADIGFFMEDFAPGSLAKSIKEAARSLPLHVFHDDMPLYSPMSFEAWPIGVAHEWDDDNNRLRGVWLLDDSLKAQRAAQLAKPDDLGRSMLGYMSIRFNPIRSAWTYADDYNPDLGPKYKDKVTRLEARLVSTSLVSTPAFTSAAVEWIRSTEPQRVRESGARELDEWARYLEHVKAGPLAAPKP
jgi:phage head maturation protease